MNEQKVNGWDFPTHFYLVLKFMALHTGKVCGFLKINEISVFSVKVNSWLLLSDRKITRLIRGVVLLALLPTLQLPEKGNL
jgi:uncharacterized membrane protein